MKKQKTIRADGAAPIPVLCYLMSVCAALMYTLCRRQFPLCAAVMCVTTGLIFLLFYSLRNKSTISALCVLVLTAAAGAAVSRAAHSSGEEDGFMQFLFTASANFDPMFAAAAILFFSVVLGFIGHYFSVISPRPCFLVLLMFIPLILSSRTLRELPAYFVLMMAGSFVFASANTSLPVSGAPAYEEKSSRIRRVIVSGAAALAVALIAAVLPRSTETPLDGYLDSFTPNVSGYNVNSALTQNFASRSSVNTGNNKLPDKVLFSVKTDYPQLLKRWAFDEYGEDGWTTIESMNSGSPGWEYNALNASQFTYLSTLLSERENISDEYQHLISGITAPESHNESMTIYLNNERQTSVILYPASAYTISGCGTTYMTMRGDCFAKRPLPRSSSYSVQFLAGKLNTEFLRRLDSDSFAGLVMEALPDDCSLPLYYEMFEAHLYQSSVSENGITPELQSLADEITAGLGNDYDKAEALEKWFGAAGFTYDLDFVPAESTPDYFLFSSRRGICSDFASALTLLARASGLPARYCEGFAMPHECYNETTGLYDITGAQAHAWTEVYIPGAGWITLDGTRYAAPADNSGARNRLIIIGGALMLAAVIFLCRKPLAWVGFNLTYHLRKPRQQARGAYIYARRTAAVMTGRDERCMSCGEVRRTLSDQLGMPDEADAICSAADRMLYSPGKDPGDTKHLLKHLRSLRKKKRRLGK